MTDKSKKINNTYYYKIKAILYMDCWSPEYWRMNHRVTATAAKLFPYPEQQSTRNRWEEQCLDKWLHDPTQTPDVQAKRRSPNYKITYAKRPPIIRN